jgi:hypothetical protein
LEGDGGVHRFEEVVDPAALQAAHDAYAKRRQRATLQHDGPQPTGGVGGTRVGIKCLHAHLANYLAGFADPVGEVVAASISLPDVVICEVRG